MTARLSSENVHATTVAKDGRAVMLLGPSGSGKSDLALRLLDHGFALVSDDRTLLRRDGDRLVASAPATIKGKMEVRGLGIVDMPWVDDVPVALAVELVSEVHRMPDESRERSFLSVPVPLVSIDPTTASAAAKVRLAIEHFGIRT
ncbi:aldolase [Sphingomonas sp. HDW15A]|uniref:HPr kinase/phosphorylase n=1 Tax=Sphingomonas sp. HDW15A TaxID=2714942 RepID=UPI00140C2D9F|nr:HPr kinase/phosphatase C-terminal domain-containing protein [Sphingomonas sp. HDW15A]QIK96171.1 aldolase [Sphingomonas sp. HDW15A]